MPTYQFRCVDCSAIAEIKVSMSEHEIIKNNMVCEKCGNKMTQTITPLNFRLKGEGWFGNNSEAVASPYGITQMEINKNLDYEKRVEDYANTMGLRDENIKEI